MLNGTQSEGADGAERRQFDRRRVLESGVIITADGRIDCQVIDISPGGVRVRPVAPVPASLARCRLRVARIVVFSGESRWLSGHAAGLGLATSADDVAERCHMLLGREGARR